ncbi:hypothetical protein ElyMa_006349700 [Elysia marginata]|uniref:Uncharacterized protein n=1 Tax=Elysia marginata TaxID=1093978 RepID=A0AAV4HL59_9GAST|nr:hypothetical protein ElyMa_006349700 [Elysia marginata]
MKSNEINSDHLFDAAMYYISENSSTILTLSAYLLKEMLTPAERESESGWLSLLTPGKPGASGEFPEVEAREITAAANTAGVRKPRTCGDNWKVMIITRKFIKLSQNLTALVGFHA